MNSQRSADTASESHAEPRRTTNKRATEQRLCPFRSRLQCAEVIRAQVGMTTHSDCPPLYCCLPAATDNRVIYTELMGA